MDQVDAGNSAKPHAGIRRGVVGGRGICADWTDRSCVHFHYGWPSSDIRLSALRVGHLGIQAALRLRYSPGLGFNAFCLVGLLLGIGCNAVNEAEVIGNSLAPGIAIRSMVRAADHAIRALLRTDPGSASIPPRRGGDRSSVMCCLPPLAPSQGK